MASIQNVMVWGTKSLLTELVVSNLILTGFSVTMLSRSAERSDRVPKQVPIKQIQDFKNSSALTAAMEGQDAIVSLVGHSGMDLQITTLDAAVAAGVKYFVPSEFGSDTTNPKFTHLPQFAMKTVMHEPLKRYAEQGKINYMLLQTGCFADLGLRNPILIDVMGQRPQEVYDGGDTPVSTTTMPDVAKALAGILKRPEEFKNRAVHVNSAIVTQNQLLAAAKKALPDAPFPVEHKRIKETLAKAQEDYKSSGLTMPVLIGLNRGTMFGGETFPQEDSKKLGIHLMSDDEVEALVTRTIKAKSQAKA